MRDKARCRVQQTCLSRCLCRCTFARSLASQEPIEHSCEQGKPHAARKKAFSSYVSAVWLEKRLLQARLLLKADMPNCVNVRLSAQLLREGCLQDDSYTYLSHQDGPDMTASLSAHTVLLLSNPSVQAHSQRADCASCDLPRDHSSVRLISVHLSKEEQLHAEPSVRLT